MTRKGERSGGWIVRAVARRLAGSDDSGATLILALIFITVVSIVTASILSFVDTSMRTTVAVRSEAGQAAAADGAAQIAINTIRTNKYTGTDSTPCLGTSDTQNLSNFYTAADGTKYSASVVCTKDTTDSQIGGGYFGGKPTYSMLALGLTGGITLDRGFLSGGHGFTLNGDIYSNSSITVYPSLTTDGVVSARGNCVTKDRITAVKVNCNTSSQVIDPGYAQPGTTADLKTPDTHPTCNIFGGAYQVFTFHPGVYTDSNYLDSFTGGGLGGLLCNTPILNFTPGIYYFDFPDLDSTWHVTDGYVVGGKAIKPLNSSIDSNMPGMCQSPIPPNPVPAGWTPPDTTDGVTFIFGGRSKLDVTNGGHVELCGRYSASAPPLAIFGNRTDIPDPNNPRKTLVRAGCIACDVIQAESLSSGEIVVQGTTYIPTGDVNVAVLINTGQRFNAGVVARSISVSGLFSSGGDIGPVSALPGPGLPWRTVVYLKVFVCTGAGPCATGGTAKNQLGVKVGIADPSGVVTAAKRQVTVYNWSVQRK